LPGAFGDNHHRAFLLREPVAQGFEEAAFAFELEGDLGHEDEIDIAAGESRVAGDESRNRGPSA